MTNKLQEEMMRGIKKDIYDFIPRESLLLGLFMYMRENGFGGISFKELKTLKEDVNDLVESLWEHQTVNDIDTFYADINKDDPTKIDIFTMQTESIGQWKSRLTKLQEQYRFDPESVKIIKDFKFQLFDRNKLPDCVGQVNPNNVNCD